MFLNYVKEFDHNSETANTTSIWERCLFLQIQSKTEIHWRFWFAFCAYERKFYSAYYKQCVVIAGGVYTQTLITNTRKNSPNHSYRHECGPLACTDYI